MRVLHVSQPTSEGTAVVVANLVASGIAHRGVADVATGPSGHLAGDVRAAGGGWIDVPMTRLPGWKDIVHWWRLRRLLVAYDVVVLHSSKAGLLGRLALLSLPRRRRPASVFMPHGWSWHTGGRLGGVYRQMERLLAPATDRIVAVSDSEAQDGETVLHGRGRIEVIANGVDITRFAPSAEPREPAMLLVVGRLARQKGQDILIRALAELDDVQLVLLGDGPARGHLQQLASELGVADRVRMVGTGAPDAWMRRATLVVVPSRWEGLSIALLEAMATGAPVVASTPGSGGILGGAGWVLAPDQTESISALADAIRLALADEGARVAFGQGARQRVLRDHAIDTSTARHRSLWATLVR
ncbi:MULTISPECIES: glycosyltransferase [unclassified Nocardioides]|uniref:glycosyltransferase n=1 Tax=unclassified Nocardioides TaxID=2615069 RepID=UPI00138F2C6F|nr:MULTISPECIES: glycosyltransferase [unclassified Nocardioides]